MLEPTNMRRSPSVKTSGLLLQSIAISASIAMLLVFYLFLSSDHFMSAQQAMFNAMAVMAEVCRL